MLFKIKHQRRPTAQAGIGGSYHPLHVPKICGHNDSDPVQNFKLLSFTNHGHQPGLGQPGGNGGQSDSLHHGLSVVFGLPGESGGGVQASRDQSL